MARDRDPHRGPPLPDRAPEPCGPVLLHARDDGSRQGRRGLVGPGPAVRCWGAAVRGRAGGGRWGRGGARRRAARGVPPLGARVPRRCAGGAGRSRAACVPSALAGRVRRLRRPPRASGRRRAGGAAAGAARARVVVAGPGARGGGAGCRGAVGATSPTITVTPGAPCSPRASTSQPARSSTAWRATARHVVFDIWPPVTKPTLALAGSPSRSRIQPPTTSSTTVAAGESTYRPAF